MSPTGNPHRTRHTGRGTQADALQLRHEAAVAATTSPAPGYAQRPIIPCPRCTHGTYGPDSNGAYWRCAYCHGTGRAYDGDAA